MKRLIACIAILLMVSLASGTATSVTIYGTNKSNAQSNITCYGCNNTISVQAWNTTYVKNISVHSRNGSGGDAVSFNISNVTAYQVQELKVNGTAINAYQAGANGMLNFTYTVVGNRTLVLSPAMNANGYNFTWGWFWNGLPNISLPSSAANLSKNNNFTGATGITEFAGDIGITYSGNTNGSNYIGVLGIDSPFFGTNMVWGGMEIETIQDIPSTTQDTQVHLVTTNSGVVGGARRVTIDRSGNVDIVSGILSGNGSGLSSLNASNVTGLPLKNQRNNVSLGRGVNTVYENTNKTARFVSMRICSNGAVGTLTFYVDAANPPTTSVSYVDTAADNYCNDFSVFVLPGHYYSLTQTGTPVLTIRSWSEWT